MTIFVCQSLVIADSIRFPLWQRDHESSRSAPTIPHPSRSRYPHQGSRLPRWSSQIISVVKPIISIIETMEKNDNAKKVHANAAFIEESTRRVHLHPDVVEESTRKVHLNPDVVEESTRRVRPHPEADKSLDAIFFSNEIHDTNKNSTERRSVLPYNRTADCVNNNICDPTSEYPTNKIFKALKVTSKTTAKLIKSLTKPSPGPSVDEDTQISLRFGGHGRDNDITMEDNVCQTEKRRITPRGALNTEGEFMWILNEQKGEHQNYVQVVETTLCRESGSECLSGQIYGHRTRCKQEYTEHKLLALDRAGEELIIDTFRFPSCCTCHVEKTFEL